MASSRIVAMGIGRSKLVSQSHIYHPNELLPPQWKGFGATMRYNDLREAVMYSFAETDQKTISRNSHLSAHNQAEQLPMSPFEGINCTLLMRTSSRYRRRRTQQGRSLEIHRPER